MPQRLMWKQTQITRRARAGDQGVIADAPISVAIHEWDGSTPIKAEAPHGALGGLGAQLASASCQAKGDAAPVCQVFYIG
jgi:hypothetical protein